MTKEKCSKCKGKLKKHDTAQFLVAWPWDRYWCDIVIYSCVECKTLHIVDSP